MAAELTLQVSAVEGSADAAANTSRVRIDLAITTTLGTWSHDYTTHGYIKLDGTQIVDLNGKWVDINTTTALYSGEHTVSHDVDGTKSVTVEAGFDMNTTYTGWSYATKTLALPDIPRASSVEMGGITLGADNTITIRAAATAFTHTLSYTLGDVTDTVCSGVSGGTVHWKPDISLCEQIRDATSGTGTLTLITYSGGNEIGRSSCAFTAYVPSAVVPSVEAVQVSPVNDKAAFREWGVYVKGYSRIGFSVTAQGAYGSAVTGGTFTCAGQTVTALSGTTGLVGAAGTFTPSATVKDSRQRTSATYSGSVLTVYDYAVPTISASYARRADASGMAQESGTYIAVQCTAACASVGGRNSVSLRVRTRYAGGSWSGYTQLQNGVQTVLSGFSAQRSYEVELSAEDALGECKTVVYAIPTEAVAFMLTDGGEGASFGKYAEHSGLDMGWDIHMNGNRVTGLAAPTAQGDALPLGYADSQYAPGSHVSDQSNPHGVTAAQVGAREDTWLPTAAQVGAAPAVADADCPECYYRTVDGVREWLNPPMVIGTEYRTTERWRGAVVYARAVNVGYVSAGSQSFAHNCAMSQPISADVYNNSSELLTGYSGITNLTVSRTHVHMSGSSPFGDITFFLKYTK